MVGDFRVGDWEVQPSVNRLRNGGQTVRLEPKVMLVLVRLAETPGEVVTREDLIASVWPDVFVSDDVLHRAIRGLRRVFGDSPSNPAFVETIRKRGYRLIAPTSVPVRRDLRPHSDLPPQADLHRWADPADLRPEVDFRAGAALRPQYGWSFSLVALTVGVLCALAVVAVAWRAGDATPQAHARFVPLVSGPLNESDPAISPDGRQVAYVQRDRSDTAPADIYLRDLADGRVTRLTTDPASDRMPTWSRDGRRLAFVRATLSSCDVVVHALATGTETVVAPCGHREEPRMTWTIDGTSLLMAYASPVQGHNPLRIARLDLDRGTFTPLTEAPPGSVGDHSPIVSPDGRTFAFIRRFSGGVSDIYMAPLAGGDARRVTFDDADLTGVDWSSDGRSILFSSDRAGGYTLWRVRIDGGEPALLAGGAARMKHPAADRTGRRVAYENWNYEINISEMELGQAGQVAGVGRAGRPVTRTSDLWNLYPQIAPDGTRIVYVSTQSGNHELWLSDRDGSNARQLTRVGGGVVKDPRWSPDGRRITYLARQSGALDVHVIDVSSGEVIALTATAANEVAPAWSHDGRDVIFGAPSQDGRWNVWAVDSAGIVRSPRLLIANAVAAQASADGDWMYFTRSDRDGLWRAPRGAADAGTLVVQAIPAFNSAGWVVTGEWVYFTADADEGVWLDAVPVTGGRPVHRASLNQMTWPGFSISPDGRHVMYARWDRRESNIMSIEY